MFGRMLTSNYDMLRYVFQNLVNCQFLKQEAYTVKSFYVCSVDTKHLGITVSFSMINYDELEFIWIDSHGIDSKLLDSNF